MFGIRARLSRNNDPTPKERFDAWNEVRPRFEDTDADTEDLAHLFTNRRRNLALAILTFAGETFDDPSMALEHLAHHVANEESDDEAPSDEAVRNVRRSLRRTHIPRLENFGIVEAKTITVDGEEFEFVEAGPNYRAATYLLNDLSEYVEEPDRV